MGGFSLGGGQSHSASTQGSEQKGTNVWQPQQQYLTDLFGKAQEALPWMQQQAATANQGLQANSDYLGSFQQPGVDPRLKMYQDQVQQNFDQNINPAIKGQSMLAGGFGNSRGQLAQGVAAGQANTDISNMATQLYGENQNRALQSVGMQGQIGQQMLGNAGMPLQYYQGLLGQPIMQDLGGSSFGSSQSRSWNAKAEKTK